jgi:hypothetical protein
MQNAQEVFNTAVSPLPDSEKLELAAMIMRSVTAPSRKISAAEFLRQLPKRNFRSAAEADEELRRERNSWND